MKLLIAIPSHDSMPVPFVRSLLSLAMRLKRDGVVFDTVIEAGTLVYMARDRLASRAVNEGYTHVLWLDSDMVFTNNILEDLLFCGKSFVSGIAHSRRPPYGSCLFKDIELETLTRWEYKDYPTGTFEVAGCGFACVLMETQVLKDVFRRYETCFTPLKDYGEDLIFCKRAAACGHRIYAEPTVVLGHVGNVTVYPEEEERYKETISNYQKMKEAR